MGTSTPTMARNSAADRSAPRRGHRRQRGRCRTRGIDPGMARAPDVGTGLRGCRPRPGEGSRSASREV